MHMHFSPIPTAALLALTTSLMAFPVSAESLDAEKRRLCTGDAMRLCMTEIPNVELVTLCMRRNKSSLSEGCKAVFDKNEVSSLAPPRPAD